MSSAETAPLTLDAVALRVYLDGSRREVREYTRAILCNSRFARPEDDLPTEARREKVAEWTEALASTGGPALLFPEEFGGLGMVGEAIASFETLALADLSLLVKCGVQFGLFGGAVHHLGTRSHHERLPLPDRHLRAARRFRDERDGSRVERAAGGNDRDLRSRERGVRGRHSDRRGPQGLHRQRGPRRAARGGLLPAGRGRGAARRALRPGAAARRRRQRPSPASASRTAGTSSG